MKVEKTIANHHNYWAQWLQNMIYRIVEGDAINFNFDRVKVPAIGTQATCEKVCENDKSQHLHKGIN